MFIWNLVEAKILQYQDVQQSKATFLAVAAEKNGWSAKFNKILKKHIVIFRTLPGVLDGAFCEHN